MNRLCAEDHGKSMTCMREMTGVRLDSLFGACFYRRTGARGASFRRDGRAGRLSAVCPDPEGVIARHAEAISRRKLLLRDASRSLSLGSPKARPEGSQ